MLPSMWALGKSVLPVGQSADIILCYGSISMGMEHERLQTGACRTELYAGRASNAIQLRVSFYHSVPGWHCLLATLVIGPMLYLVV